MDFTFQEEVNDFIVNHDKQMKIIREIQYSMENRMDKKYTYWDIFIGFFIIYIIISICKQLNNYY